MAPRPAPPDPDRRPGARRGAARGAGGAVLALLVGPAGPAAAHATLQDTSPASEAVVDAPPDAVTLRFDEPVSVATGGVKIIDAAGGRVDGAIETSDGGRTVSAALDGDEIGTYTVAFRVVSDDGHTISGSLVFHVQTQTGAADIDQSIPVLTSATGGVGRWLSYAGAIVAVGAAVLLALTRRSGGPGAAAATLRRLVVGGAAVGALGGFLAVLAQTALTTGRSITGALGLVSEVAGDSRPVAVALGRAGVVALGAVVALVAGRRPSGLYAAAGVVALGGLLAPIAGHPWTADPVAVAVPADGLHLLAASVWVGLLAALALTAPRLPDPLAAVRGVSTLALVASGVLLVTGTISAWLLLGSVDALLHTASGQLVIAKVIGFAALITLGWINRSRLVPLLARAVGAETVEAPEPVLVGVGPEPSAGTDDGLDPATEVPAGAAPPPPTSVATAVSRLVQVVRVEVVVAALVLVVTAGLVNQPPGRDVVAEPFVETQTIDGSTVLFEVEPAQAGTNEMHLYVTDDTGNPAPVDALEVSAGREGVPERKLTVEQISPDHAVVYGASLPTPGTWEVDVTTVRVGVPRQYTFEVPVR